MTKLNSKWGKNMEDRYLEVRKENIFNKITSFFKNIFRKKTNIETPQQVETKEEKEVQNNNFIEAFNKENDDQKLLKLQNQFENNEIDISVFTNDELEKLYLLYEKQNEELRKILADKLNQLDIIKRRIESYKK